MKQKEKIYMISDAAKQVQVESHVLRYWEEELKLKTKRNEMGHRYYTQEDVRQFCKIKELKEQGLQLKAIRSMLKNGMLFSQPEIFGKTQTADKCNEVQQIYENGSNFGEELGKRHVMMVRKGEFLPVQEENREQKSIRLQQLLRDMIMEALHDNNRELGQEIKESLLKELDYQFRLQEEREDIREEERIGRQEEHYRQVDELIRSCNQKGKGVLGKLRGKQLIKKK